MLIGRLLAATALAGLALAGPAVAAPKNVIKALTYLNGTTFGEGILDGTIDPTTGLAHVIPEFNCDSGSHTCTLDGGLLNGITSMTVQDGPNSPTQIYSPQYPAGSGYYTTDAHRVSMTVAPGSSGAPNPAANVDALGLYLLNDSPSSGSRGNGVVVFGTGVGAATSSNTWFLNGTLVDNPNRSAAATGSGKKLIGGELDFSTDLTDTVVQGFSLNGSSGVKPASANGYTCGSLGGPALWDQCFVVGDGTSTGGVYLGGASTSGTNVPSAPITFAYLDGSGQHQLMRLLANLGGLNVVPNNPGNGIVLSTSALGADPIISAFGGDASVGLDFHSKGGAAINAFDPFVALNLFAANGSIIEAQTHTPASSSEACAAGTRTHDTTAIYVCVSTNTWLKFLGTTF